MTPHGTRPLPLGVARLARCRSAHWARPWASCGGSDVGLHSRPAGLGRDAVSWRRAAEVHPLSCALSERQGDRLCALWEESADGNASTGKAEKIDNQAANRPEVKTTPDRQPGNPESPA